MTDVLTVGVGHVGEILRDIDRSDILARGGFALEGRLGLHVLEDTTEGIVVVDILEDLTAAGLEKHPSKHVRLGNQDTVAGRLQEEPDERALRVDVGVRELWHLKRNPVVRRRGPRVVSTGVGGKNVGANTLDTWDHLHHLTRHETSGTCFHCCLL